MGYSVYKLEFSTGLHIGQDTGGPSLDDGKMTIHSDTLFSALCCEGVKQGLLPQLVKYFKENILAISDTFPFSGEELFLPKPILFTGNRQKEGDPALRKQFKSLAYIPLASFTDYIQGLKGASFDLGGIENEFGSLTVDTKVALSRLEKPQPYHLASWRFKKNCGLYLIVKAEEQEALAIFLKLLTALGLSGIGGKQSVGLGKFTIEEIEMPGELLSLLENKNKASYQMILGTALPNDSDLEAVIQDGWYALLRRGGFIRSETYGEGQLKKRTIHMLAPGSCLKNRFLGGLFDLADGGGTHPVWRCGNTLFAGVNI